MTQISAFCLKNQSHPALKLDLPPSSISRRTPKTQRSSMNLGSLPSMYGTNLLLDQLLRICTCHSDLVLTQKHRKQGSPLTDTLSAGFSSYDGEFRLPLVLAQASPIFHSSCEGKLGIALE